MEHISRFSETVEQVSDSILSLLKIFENSRLSLVEGLRDLDDDLLAFANTIISLSRQFQNGYENRDYYENEDPSLYEILSLFTALVENARPCISRLERNIINVTRSGWSDLQEYIQAAELDGELQHLRLRIIIYKTVTSIPVMMYTTHPLFAQINLPSNTLASRTIQHTLAKLSHDTQRLSTDSRIRSSPMPPTLPPEGSGNNSSSRHSLHNQRVDLIAILAPLQTRIRGLISQEPIRSHSLSARHSSTSNYIRSSTSTPTILTPSSPTPSTIAPFFSMPSFIQPPPSPNPALHYTQSFPAFAISVLDLEPRARTGEHGDDLVSIAQSMNSLGIGMEVEQDSLNHGRRQIRRGVDGPFLEPERRGGRKEWLRRRSWN